MYAECGNKYVGIVGLLWWRPGYRFRLGILVIFLSIANVIGYTSVLLYIYKLSIVSNI